MQTYDYLIKQGETFEGCFYLLDDEGCALDLNGMKAKGQIRTPKKDSGLIAEFHTGIDMDEACVSYNLSALETKAIPVGDYEYDVCLYEDTVSGRIVYYYIGGKFMVTRRITEAV